MVVNSRFAVGQSFPVLFAAWVSLKRINKFLSMKEKQPLALMSESQSNDEKGNPQTNAGLIQLRDSSFAWDFDGQPVLHDLTFTLRPGVLYMCVGPVASVCLSCYGDVFLRLSGL